MTVRRTLSACVVGALLLTTNGAFAARGMTSVNIVEPRAQSKWGYAPATVKVQPGTWVTWSNAGQDAHTVTAVDGSFDSGNLDPSDGFSWYFADPGTVEYTCTLHAWMTGKVIVGTGGPTNPPPLGDPVPADDASPPPAE